jgi:magnesium chelatase subunit D
MTSGLASSGEEMRAADLILEAERRWTDACTAAALLALDPGTLGGIHIRSGPNPARDRWLSLFEGMGGGVPAYALTGLADQAAIEGGFDVVASLASSSVSMEQGLEGRAGERPVLVRMADQMRPAPAHALCRILDRGGLPGGFVLFDEGGDDEAAPAVLSERAAFVAVLDAVPVGLLCDETPPRTEIEKARVRLDGVTLSDSRVEALSSACLACGARSMRILLHAVAAARGLAALEGRSAASDEDVAEAARLVIAPKAQHPPAEAAEQESEEEPPEQEEPPSQTPEETDPADNGTDGIAELEEAVIDAVRSGMVSLSLAMGETPRKMAPRKEGRSGQIRRSLREGRPAGAGRGDPRQGARLDILATLRAAAPWQKLRPPPNEGSLLRIYPSDLRVKRFVHKAGTSVIFVIDASGSAAMHRLAEAKGAVESLLAECYSRRDSVAVIAFKGQKAELVLPPSRSLTRARRAMAGLPGGGGTPLSSAMALALETALGERRDGRQPLLVFLTDGRGNIALSGEPDPQKAEGEIQSLTRLAAGEALDAIVFDTSRRPQERVRQLAGGMNARYVPLPYADGTVVSAAVGEERRKLKAERR